MAAGRAKGPRFRSRSDRGVAVLEPVGTWDLWHCARGVGAQTMEIVNDTEERTMATRAAIDDDAAGVVRECADRVISRVWLHKGVGASSVSAEAIAVCHDRGIAVIDGACPPMFVPHTGLVHPPPGRAAPHRRAPGMRAPTSRTMRARHESMDRRHG